MSKKIEVLKPDLQVSFYYRLKSVKETYFHIALKNAIKELDIVEIDKELNRLVSKKSLSKLAAFSLRGEAVFPTPTVLIKNPFLLGYYRLLLGFSKKEFYSKGPFGSFKAMEEKGKITSTVHHKIEALSESLIKSSEILVREMDEFTLDIIKELQLLTVGPQFRGSMNNKFGQIATQKTFDLIKEIVKDYIISSTPTEIEMNNDTGRKVKIAFASDPDIEIKEELSSSNRGLVSIEIKGGRDYSNIHNRIGEAEKSHQKAKKLGYFEFITILSVDIDYELLKEESPTTSHFFNLDKIVDKNSSEFQRFKDILTSMISIR